MNDGRAEDGAPVSRRSDMEGFHGMGDGRNHLVGMGCVAEAVRCGSLLVLRGQGSWKEGLHSELGRMV